MASGMENGRGQGLILPHMPSIDKLRGTAVLMVVLFHGLAVPLWMHTLGPFWGTLALQAIGLGRFGVDVFFVISGFLITGILLNTRERPDYYRTFYQHRALRILPAYLLTLVGLRLLGVIDWRFALAAILFLPNFSRLFGAPLTEYGVLWTLGVEEQFYLLWPFFVRRFRERTLYCLLLTALVAEPALRLTAALLIGRIDIHYKTPFVLDYLAYGALLALLVRGRTLHAGNAARVGGALLAVGAALAFVDVWAFSFHNGAPVQALGDLPFSWGTCGAILLGLRRDHRRAARTGRTDARGVLAFYGSISYGLYLTHLEVYAQAKDWGVRHFGAGLLDRAALLFPGVAVCIAAATGLAWLSRRYYEEPFLRLKKQKIQMPASADAGARL